MIGVSQPWDPVRESGVLELVGKNEQVDQNEFGAAVSLTMPGTQASSGKLLAFTFIATEEGTGAVQDSAGQLLIFDADPGHSAGDDGSGISGAEWKTLIGAVAVASTDWTTEEAGGFAYKQPTLPIPFHEVDTLYFVWRHTDATSLNDGAGDDEVLDVNVWYERAS